MDIIQCFTRVISQTFIMIWQRLFSHYEKIIKAHTSLFISSFYTTTCTSSCTSSSSSYSHYYSSCRVVQNNYFIHTLLSSPLSPKGLTTVLNSRQPNHHYFHSSVPFLQTTNSGNNSMVVDIMDAGTVSLSDAALQNEVGKVFCSPITKSMRDEWRVNFFADSKNIVALQACSKLDPLEVCLSRSGIEDTNSVFTHKIDQEGKPISNQKSSGRCWLFAFLNSVRVPFMKQYNIDEFEFSQSHLFFWDKLERCNHHLNNVAKAYKKGEKLDGRLMAFLLQDPISDGGQWGMVVNLVREYGLMPKKNFPESFSSESSGRLNTILRSKLREFSKDIRDLLEANGTEVEAHELIAKQMSQIYRIVAICLGVPKNEFVWEYYDKAKAYHKVGPISSKQFYDEYVKPIYDVETKLCLVHDPRPNNPYGNTYMVEYLGNMVTGRPTIYNNQPVELLLNLTADAIKAGELVWFGCEVSKRFAAKQGIEDLEIHDYKSVFGVDVALGLQKSDRLIYGESCMSHAMVFTAVTLDDNEVPTKFRVENSWGDDRGDKGYLVMTADWFREFVFEVVIDKIHLPLDVIATNEKEPTVLPAWDPMGTLACKNCVEEKSNL